VLHYQGDYSAAEPHMQRFLNTMYGNRAWVEHGALGRVHVGLNAIAVGDYSAALAHLEGSRSTFRDIGQQDLDDDAFAQSALSLVFHQTAIIRRRTTMRWVPWLSIAAQVTITARRPH
jgi:hypothetical protein